MMAGTGVSAGGAGMLRTRRRDVSVKPNRKLDRKSSRGMIYENEELRLRTIHINAEVEQGQNDIKKLRRENEQLRREIWSLRDEYDKLEEILKRQKNQEESEDYEDRSEEDDALRSDYSCEDDEEVDEGEEEVEDPKARGDGNQSERLENAENQKISSEKMNSSGGGTGGLHRLHVDFDDLSVVDEEEEVKKEKERKEAASSDEPQPSKEGLRNPTRVIGPRQLHENIPFYPAAYEPSGAYSGTSYYQNCPFEFPGRVNPMDPSAMLTTPCPRMYADPLIPLANLEPPVLSQVPDQILPQIHMPPVGWQNNVMQAEKQLSSYPASTTSPGIPILSTSEPRAHLESQGAEFRHFGSPLSPSTVYSNFSSPSQRKTAPRQPSKLPAANHFEDFTELSSGKPVVRNGWTKPVDSAGESGEDQRGEAIASRKQEDGAQEASALSVSDRPKHFFAPLPSKVKRQVEQEESPTASTSYFGTGNSSSSGKTGSTVISRSNPFVGLKGSADIYVNGAVPFEDGARRDRDEQKTFLSYDNLLIDDGRSCGNSPLTKSMSCQDLSSEAQNISVSEQLKASHNEGKPQLLTKSDNTLDNITSGPSGRPYKTHLNVTLKVPRIERSPSPETPEIPKLPSIDYRLFKNPFLRKFEPTVPTYGDRPSPVTRPLSIQVNDNAGCHYPSPPALSTFNRDFHLTEKYHTAPRGQPSQQNRLLIPSDQLADGKILSPTNKQDIQVTSFERPSPHALLPTAIPYDLETLRRITANRYLQAQNLYQNVPFVPRGPGHVCPQTSAGGVRMYYDNVATKVPAQTQTSIDGDYRQEDDHPAGGNRDEENASASNSPGAQRRKRPMKKEKSSTVKDPKPLSPAAQRRLRKQSSLTSTEAPDSPGKSARHRPRKLSVTTTTTSEAQEDKNESRSSSSGQDSPRKDQQNRRVSIYFNAKKRPSLASVKTMRSGSLDASKDKYLDGTTTTTNSERERTNSVSSREGVKARKASTSSGNVPWCACWGNGCI